MPPLANSEANSDPQLSSDTPPSEPNNPAPPPEPDNPAIPSVPENPATEFPNAHTHIRTLNTGSESTVDLWRETHSATLIAVKSLGTRPQVLLNAIPNEAYVLRHLPRHANVIALYAVAYDIGAPGRDCLIFEYCAVGDLWSVAQRANGNAMKGSFSAAFLWSVYSQLCSALAFLHTGSGAPRGTNTDSWTPVVHRDIKLENIFVTTLGTKNDWSSIEVKMGDFGFAREYDEQNGDMHRAIGTPDYWPPEMTWASRHYGPEADVWAIGAVVHELAHGFPPIFHPVVYEHYILNKQPENMPLRHEEWSSGLRDFYWRIETPRRVHPINVDSGQPERVEDPRRKRPTPNYGGELNLCMMMALTMDKKSRAGAGTLKEKVEEGYAAFLFEELSMEHERAMGEAKGSGSEGESNDVVEDNIL